MNVTGRRIKRWGSVLLILSMLLGLLMGSAYAQTEQDDAQAPQKGSVELKFVYPEDVPKEDVKLNVFQGIPQWRQKNEAETVRMCPPC